MTITTKRTFTKLLTATGLTLGLGLSVATVPLNAGWAQTPDNMLVIANRIDDITTLDPAESFEFAGADVIRNIYGKLVNFDPTDLDAGFQPDIAESWTVSEDGKTVTFTIREGMKFTSGNPVRAEDAAFSLRRAVKLNKTPAFILTQFGFTAENADDVITFDGNTVSITTDKKYATSFILNCLTATIGAIVDKETVMANAVGDDMGNEWLKTNSAGSYAYKLDSWKPSDSVTMSANPDFYLGAPAMQRVIVRHIQESATQRLQLERGDIDIARNLNPEDVAAVTGKDGLAIESELRGRLMYMSFNQNRAPQLQNPKVLEAIKHLIDYKGMQDSFLKGQYVIHQSFLPSTYFGQIDDKPFSYDPEKAKALLAEAGVGEFEIEIGVREAQERVEIAQSVQNTFAQAGIKVNITIGTGKQVLTRYRARELDVYLGAWGPDYPDPQTNAGTFAYNPDNSDAAKATGLLAWRNSYDPGELNAMVEAAVTEADTDKRRGMYEEMQRKHQQTAPFAVMFQQIEQYGKKANISGLTLGGAITSAGYWKVTK